MIDERASKKATTNAGSRCFPQRGTNVRSAARVGQKSTSAETDSVVAVAASSHRSSPCSSSERIGDTGAIVERPTRGGKRHFDRQLQHVILELRDDDDAVADDVVLLEVKCDVMSRG
jgi:hypothetical protein